MQTLAKNLLIFLLPILFTNCQPQTEKCCGDESFRKWQDSLAHANHNWEVLKDKLYLLSDNHLDTAIYLLQIKLDSVEGSNTNSYPSKEEKLSDLHFMKGEFYFRRGDFERAVHEFSYSNEEDFRIAARIAQGYYAHGNSNLLDSNRVLPTRRWDYIRKHEELNKGKDHPKND